jgi:hypothetical protein
MTQNSGRHRTDDSRQRDQRANDSDPRRLMSLLVESGPRADTLTCEETIFNETPTVRGLTQSGLWRRNAPPIGPTVRGRDLRSLIQSGPPRQDRQDSVR